MVKILSADFDEMSPPPDIQSTTTTATSTSITINLALSSSGMVYCHAVPIDDDAVPLVSEMKLYDNHCATGSGNNATVVIPHLMAVTNYKLYCMTLSEQGVPMDNAVFLSQSASLIANTGKSLTCDGYLFIFKSKI
jgi:hypothetical protein